MSQPQLRFFRVWLGICLSGCAVLVYACLMPNPPQPQGIAYFDKVEHILAFCVLGAGFGAILQDCHVRVLVGLALLGGVIELLQSLTAYRSGDPLDMVADVAGIIIGLLMARFGMMRWLYYIDQHAFPERNKS